MDSKLAALTRANAREILAAFKLDRLGCFQPLAEWLASLPARRLARQILRFDDLVSQHGLAAAGRRILDEFTGSTDIEGQRHVPTCGPLLAVSNHPGVVDAMAIWVALEHRPDLRIIASKRELLQLLPGIGSRLLLVDPRKGNRSSLLRDAAAHLRRGGALLTFPAGAIEPDPSLRAAGTLGGWSDSTDLLLRLVPETTVLPIAVSGVISRAAHRHPLAKRFADPREREWAAATLQVLLPHLRQARTRVLVGEPIPGRIGSPVVVQAAMASLLARAGNPSTASSDGGRSEAARLGRAMQEAPARRPGVAGLE